MTPGPTSELAKWYFNCVDRDRVKLHMIICTFFYVRKFRIEIAYWRVFHTFNFYFSLEGLFYFMYSFFIEPKSDNRLEKKEGEHSENQHLTVEIIVREVGIRKEVLDQRCSSEVLEEIGRVLPNWLKYAKVLLSKTQIQGIKSDANLDYEMRGQKVLEIWHSEYSTSYRMLVDICLKLKDGETARRICEIVKG